MRRRLGLLAAVLAAGATWWLLPDAEAARGTWWSIVPPALAISLALVFREVLVALFLGVWVGASILAGGELGAGLLRAVDTSVRTALTDSDHVSIVLFSLLLGGMVGVMSRSGGTHGIVRLLEPLATTPRRAQLATWLMGVAIFFDDYSNTLIVGNSMRPVCDRHRVSREKLAFLVDSTAAPVTCVALVSTWVGTQVSLLGDAIAAQGLDANPFSVFLASLTSAYYPFVALAITLAVALLGRDWGPMRRAELRAAAGEVLREGSQPLADYEGAGFEPDPETPRRWWNAALPVVTVVVVTLVGLYLTGLEARVAAGDPSPRLYDVVGASDPFTVLLWASLLGLLVAIGLAVVPGPLDLRQALAAAVVGFRSMLLAMVVLTFAWALGDVCVKLDTARWLVALVESALPAAMVPTAVFAVAAAVSFATGTSWGTMAILTPLAVPLVVHAASPDSLGLLLPLTASAILGGSVFGDHCSPISDTTIMSSMASGCDHVDHVRTQLPYALLGAAAAILLGYLPAGYGLAPEWLLLPLVLAAPVVFLRLAGRGDVAD